MAQIKIDKKNLFRAYNQAVHTTKTNQKIDPVRLRKALGIAQSNKRDEKFNEYGTTMESCRCWDSSRPTICKHRLARMLLSRMEHPIPDDVLELDAMLADPTIGTVTVSGTIDPLAVRAEFIAQDKERADRTKRSTRFDKAWEQVIRYNREHGITS